MGIHSDYQNITNGKKREKLVRKGRQFFCTLYRKKRLPAISAKSAASSSGLGKALAKATRPNITRLLIS